MYRARKYTKKNKKLLRDYALSDDDHSVVCGESQSDADSFSNGSEADFLANQRRKKKRVIVSSDEDTEDTDVLTGGDRASCSPETTDNEPNIDDDNTWYDSKEKLTEFAFDDSKCGIQMNADNCSIPRDIFDQLFSKDIVETLVGCTNRYGKNLFETVRPATRNTEKLSFTETDAEELLKFLGLCLLQGQKRAPSIRTCSPTILFTIHQYSRTLCLVAVSNSSGHKPPLCPECFESYHS